MDAGDGVKGKDYHHLDPIMMLPWLKRLGG